MPFLAIPSSSSPVVVEALAQAEVSPRSWPSLNMLLTELSRQLGDGKPIRIKLADLAQRLHRGQRSVRNYLGKLVKMGFLDKKHAGPQGLVLQALEPILLKKLSGPSDLSHVSERRRLAIEERLLHEPEKIYDPERFKRHLAHDMDDEEETYWLAKRARRLDPAPSITAEPAIESVEEVLQKDAPASVDIASTPHKEAEVVKRTPKISDEVREAAAWRLFEKESEPKFSGFARGREAYFYAVCRELTKNPQQVHEILARKKTATEQAALEETRRQAEEEKKRAAAEAARAAAVAREELLARYRAATIDERARFEERALALLPNNLRGVSKTNIFWLEAFENALVKAVEERDAPAAAPLDFVAPFEKRSPGRKKGMLQKIGDVLDQLRRGLP